VQTPITRRPPLLQREQIFQKPGSGNAQRVHNGASRGRPGWPWIVRSVRTVPGSGRMRRSELAGGLGNPAGCASFAHGARRVLLGTRYPRLNH